MPQHYYLIDTLVLKTRCHDTWCAASLFNFFSSIYSLVGLLSCCCLGYTHDWPYFSSIYKYKLHFFWWFFCLIFLFMHVTSNCEMENRPNTYFRLNKLVPWLDSPTWCLLCFSLLLSVFIKVFSCSRNKSSSSFSLASSTSDFSSLCENGKDMSNQRIPKLLSTINALHP